jgi:hypothetical protein
MVICNPWRPGACCLVLREQVDVRAPFRWKASDGTIGDAAHQAEACSSQHNSCCIRLNGVWIIRAIDITHDPNHGCDIGVIFDRIRASRDPRVRYLIFNDRICYPTARNGYAAWAWQPYQPTNPKRDRHRNHGHLSTFDSPVLFDNTRAWSIGGPTPPGVQPAATKEDDVSMLATDNGKRLYACDLQTSTLVWDEGMVERHRGDIIYLAGQMGYARGGGDGAEWQDGGMVRKGWSEAVFGKLVAPEGQLDVEALAQQIAHAVVVAPDNPTTQADAEAVASAVLSKLKAAFGGAA